MTDLPSSQEDKEPTFMAVARNSPDMRAAHSKAAATITRFIEHIHSGAPGFCSAKLRFRDPDESERLGEDRLLYLWLTGVEYDPDEKLFSGTFFEVPTELQKWHHVGEELGFYAEDIFDWMFLTENGRLFGGYTLRVSRAMLPEDQRADYDSHIGVRTYEETP